MFESVLLYTDNMTILRRFYKNVLGLKITLVEDDFFTVRIGTSNLTFKQTSTPARYHFAVNIPGNQFFIMKTELEKRLTLRRRAGANQFYSEQFNADTLYFNDPVGNRVKLIGRRDRDLLGPLTSDAFLDISEVKIITPYIVEVGNQLQDFGVPLYHKATIDPDAINYLGENDTYIALEKPIKAELFSNHRPLKTHPLEIVLYDKGRIVLDDAGNIHLTKNHVD